MVSSVICEELDKAADRYANQIALQMYADDGIHGYTYAQTHRFAKNLSGSLRQKGIKRGDSIAIWSPTGPKWAIAYLATLYSGAVVVPLDLEYDASQAQSVLSETGCKLVFTTKEKLPVLCTLTDALPALPVLVTLDSASESGDPYVGELWNDGEGGSFLAAISPEDIATIIYTSGTTGRPKGVVISHQSVAATIQGMLEYLDVETGDNVLAAVPSHHVFAPIGSLLVPLLAGATVTYVQGVSSSGLLKVFQEAGITIFPCVPQVFYLLHKRIFEEARKKTLLIRVVFNSLLSISRSIRQRTGISLGRLWFASVHKAFGGRLRLMVSGGAYFDPKIIRDFQALGFTVQQGYGLTESFGGGTFTPVNRNVPGSVGVPLRLTEIRVVEADSSGIGEIAISGPSLMQGYFKDPQFTSEVLRDGWLYTGDLGYQDASGNLYITGRRKEMIVLSSGKKISPEELEEHYLQTPRFKELCILGVSGISHYAHTEALHAIIVPDFEYLKSRQLANTREAIREEIERLSALLPTYKRILTYEVQANPLPRTATRKLMRWVLQNQLEARAPQNGAWQGKTYNFLAGDELLLESETSRKVLNVLARESILDPELHLDMNLELDLGFDSLQRIELIANIEELLGVRLDDAVSRCLTVRDLLKEILQKEKAGQAGGDERGTPKRITWKAILDSAASDNIAEKYILKTRPFTTAINFVGLKLIFVLAKSLFRLQVEGAENLPQQGPYLICPNHQSYLDGVLVCSVFPYRVIRELFSLGWARVLTGRLTSVLARLIHAVPIDSNSNILRAMQISAVGLRAKKILLIFPEGGLSLNGELQPFKPGAAILAGELHVPVVPVAIKGSFDIWSKGGDSIRLAAVKIGIGRPMDLRIPAQETNNRGERYAEAVQELERQVSHLFSDL